LVLVALTGCSTTVVGPSMGPLDAMFGGPGRFSSIQESVADEIEASVRRCMSLAGFTYSPESPVPSYAFSVNNLTPPARSETESVGYGVVQFFLDTAETGSEIEPPSEEYLVALVGGPLGEQPVPQADQGCVGSAISDVFGSASQLQAVEVLDERYFDHLARLESKPEVLLAGAEWALCMSDAGFEYGSRQAIVDDIEDRAIKASDSLAYRLRGLSEVEQQAILGDSMGEPPESSPLDLIEVQDKELLIAATDQSCFNSRVVELFEPVRDEAERSFIEQNRTILEWMVSEWG